MTQRLLDAWPHVQGMALVCYGDTLANVSIEKLVRRHQNSASDATLALYRPLSSFGIVKFDRTRKVVSFTEKPRLPHWINIGFLLCNPAALASTLQLAGDMVEFLSGLASQGRLAAFEHRGKHLTINTEKERQQAETEVIEFLSIVD